MFMYRDVRRTMVSMLAVLAVVALGADTAWAADKVVKVAFPVPTEDIGPVVPAVWQRTGVILRNLYPQPGTKNGKPSLVEDPKPELSLTLRIKYPDSVLFEDGSREKSVTIPAGRASMTFRIKVSGTWKAGEQPQVEEGSVTGSDGAAYRVVNIPANVRASQILSQLDINGDGSPDAAPDSDGDGLPDNWEQGGYRTWQATAEETSGDRLVKFSAPTAIGPGTPPTFVLNRQAVSTSATTYDSDGDGLSDFVEVFGLKYIDRDGNGVLGLDEWHDWNNDGLPSIGEGPIKQTDEGRNLLSNFAGFVFTDPSPSGADTDGDGFLDSEDSEPLINPETFGVDRGNFARIGTKESKADLDNDGLGNGADFGNDTDEKRVVDSPEDLPNLIRIFRNNLYSVNGGLARIPEALIEDLIGADWDGNGLYRVTDVRNFRPVITADDLQELFPTRVQELFYVGSHPLFSEQKASEFRAYIQARDWQKVPVTPYGEEHLGLGLQDLLVPDQLSLPYFPDVRIWTILYAWRMPGFDIDGNGFVGGPAKVTVQQDGQNVEKGLFVDDIHEVATAGRLDGQITSPLDFSNCGVGASQALLLTLLGLSAMKATIAPRMRRRQG